MSSKGNSIEDKSCDLQEEIKNKRPTVEELLKMLSGNTSTNSKRPSPPPIPPKPRHGFEMSIEAAKRSLGLLPTETEKPHNRILKTENKHKTTGLGGDKINNRMTNDEDHIFMSRKKSDNIQPETDTLIHSSSQLRFYENNHPFDKATSVINPSQKSSKLHGSCIVYDSASTTNVIYQHQSPEAVGNHDEISNEHCIEPFVTESPEEANNNIIKLSGNNRSTVEILEVPSVENSSRDIHGNASNIATVDKFFRPQHQHMRTQHENLNRTSVNPYVVSVVTPTTDEGDDDYDSGTEGAQLSKEVETIMSNSLNDGQPPRTSTPTPTSALYRIDDNSSSGTSTAINNSRSNQVASYLQELAPTQDTSKREADFEGDFLNISRETDELTNTSAHNQSGCELVGVNDNSFSKDSPKKNRLDQEQDPYTVQFFNDTALMSPSVSPPETDQQLSPTSIAKSVSRKYEVRLQDQSDISLRSLVVDLQKDIESLSTKLNDLSKKVENLENKLENGLQVRSSDISDINDAQHSDESPTNTIQKNSSISQSVATNHRLTPLKNSRHNTNGSASTYSRGVITTINSQPLRQNSSLSRSNLHPSNSMLHSSKRAQPQSINTLSKHQPRKSIYTSTNSLYGDSNKSGSASISPTPLDSSSSRHYASPTSYLTQRREPSAYTSMLSLSSIGNSTLRNSSIAGSVSNLSQVSASHLSNWPSLSNFISSKHQAKDILYDEEDQVIKMVLYNTLITMRLPSNYQNNYSLDGFVIEPPSVKLRLKWVHGYRGRDCRSNIYYLPTGECVYFIASIVVLYSPDEKTQRHYLGHTDSVKCLAVHPNKLIVASGQSANPNRQDRRPIVRVWNTVSLATLRVIGFNEDFDRPICCLAFSKHDAGATLAVVDESSEHTITLLDWQREKNWRVSEVNSGHEPVLAIDFHPIDKYSLVAVGKSSINFWDIRGMTLAKKAGLFDKYDRPKYVLCMTFNDIGETITGDSNGNIILWPRGSNKPKRIIRDAHSGGVFSVLAMKDGSYLTGGRDRRIIEWDEDFEPTGRHAELPEHCGGVRFITPARGFNVLIGTLRNSILLGCIEVGFQIIVQGHVEATSAVAVHPNQQKFLTGGFDDQIHFIDATTHQLEWTKCMAMPTTAASFSPYGLILIVGSTSGNWFALDAINQDILFSACDGNGTINCIKYSPDGQYFCLGSSDCHVYVYKTTEDSSIFSRVGTCVGHSAPIREIDWSNDSCYIQTQSMNFELLFWNAHSCRPVDNHDTVHDLTWSTHNCTIGFNVIGIWSETIDSALINYCDKSNNDRYIVSVTDTGYINIHKWPTCYNQCLSQKYYGNVDKFNFVKFLPGDTRLIAIGAKSCVTTEWAVLD